MEERTHINKLLHDLKGPVTVVMGFLQSIENIEIATSDFSEYYKAALKSIGKINEMISKFEQRV